MIGKNECIAYEFDFDLKDALQGMAEVNFYLGEYRQRVLSYKYAKYSEQDEERKEKKMREKMLEDEAKEDVGDAPADAEKTEDKWEENKDSKETLAVFNYKKAAAHYLRATVNIRDGLRQLLDNAH